MGYRDRVSRIVILGVLAFLIGFVLIGHVDAQSYIQPPNRLVAWWPGDRHTDDIVGSNHGTLLGDATFASRLVDQAFSLDENGDIIDLGSNNIIGSGSTPFTFAAWSSLTSPPGVQDSVPPPGPFVFREGWESASVGAYSPVNTSDDNVTMIPADEGSWFLGDTVSEFPECGPTPHRAEIFAQGEGQALRLTSNDSHSDCSDNVAVALFEVAPLNLNTGFSVSISPNTVISFEMTGELINPQRGFPTCLLPPCGDAISLRIEDTSRGVGLAYILHRASDREPNELHSFYREILLDPDAGTYNRNLFDDFRTIPDFNPNGAQVNFIVFEVDEHGFAIIDNLAIE
jgi:hypothetical protein